MHVLDRKIYLSCSLLEVLELSGVNQALTSINKPRLRILQSLIPLPIPPLPTPHTLHLLLPQLKPIIKMRKHTLPPARTTHLSFRILPPDMLLERVVWDAEDVYCGVLPEEEFKRVGDLVCGGEVDEA